MEQFNQALRSDASTADILYAIGEVYLRQEEYREAFSYYEQSLDADPEFAPAYLGRARAQQALKPGADIAADILTAIEKDPNYGEAHLAYTEYLLSQDDPEAALESLDQAEAALPGSPLVHLHRARVLLAQGEAEAALESARQANTLDETLLESYLLLGQAAAANGEHDEAMEAVEVYLAYDEQNAAAWSVQAQALFAGGQYSQALDAANRAIELDKGLTEAYRYRGLAQLELDEGRQAVNDLWLVLQADTQSYRNNLDFSRALLAAGRLGDALGQINRAEDFAQDDGELAAVYFWRAQIFEQIGNMPSAAKDWKSLAALSEADAPEDWLELAEERLKATATPLPPTPTATATRTPRPSSTPRPTATK
jgi:tetratricopeptide (TPR) repeat protein